MRITNNPITNFKQNQVFNTFSSVSGKNDRYQPTRLAPETVKYKQNVFTDAKAIFGAAVLAVGGGFAVFKGLKKGKTGDIKDAVFELTKKDCMNKSYEGVDLIDGMKNILKRAYFDILSSKGNLASRGTNGILIYGPKSKGREDFFNWVLDQFKKTGVEIVDTSVPGKGVTKMEDLATKLDEVFKRRSAEAFQKDGKYTLFVVRGIDELIPAERILQKGKKRASVELSGILKGETHDSCKRQGIILLYDCTDLSKVELPVYRKGRISNTLNPPPNKDESIELWKEYLNESRFSDLPATAKYEIEHAKKVFQEKGAEVVKEMEEYTKYIIPFQHPEDTAPLAHWKEYVAATGTELPKKQILNVFSSDLDGLGELIKQSPETIDKFNKICEEMFKYLDGEELETLQKLQKGTINIQR